MHRREGGRERTFRWWVGEVRNSKAESGLHWLMTASDLFSEERTTICRARTGGGAIQIMS